MHEASPLPVFYHYFASSESPLINAATSASKLPNSLVTTFTGGTTLGAAPNPRFAGIGTGVCSIVTLGGIVGLGAATFGATGCGIGAFTGGKASTSGVIFSPVIS